MKKFISVMLVITLVLSLLMPVFAEDTDEYISIGEGTTTVSAKSFFEYTPGGSANASPTYSGNYFKYRLNFEKSGMYKVYITNKKFDNNGTATLYIDEGVVGTGTIPNSGGVLQTTEFCTISAEAGNCVFKYVNGSEAVYLSSFIFEYVGPRTDYNINANNYSSISTGVTDNKPATGMSTNSCAEYKFTADAKGTYGIFARVASVAKNTATVQATVGDTLVGSKQFISGDTKVAGSWADFTEVYIGSVALDSGEHTLKITAAGNSMRLGSIRFKVVHTETEQAFLSGMQEASNYADISRVLGEFNDKLIIPYDDYINKLCYRRVFDEQLLGLPYESLAETDSQILSLLEIELANPLVTLTRNGETVTEVSEGDLIVNIAPRFEQDLIAIAALYTDDYMTLKDYSSTSVSPYKEASIRGLTATADGKKFKIFFFEDTDSLRPVDLPEVIQTQIFVSPDGSDTNDGLPSKPLATIEGAIARVNELNSERQRDITVFLDSGEYVLDDTITLDESFSSHDVYGVHFKSLTPTNPAVISGGYDVTGWTDTDGDGIYTAQLPSSITDVRQLYIDEQPAQRARSENYFLADGRWNDETNDDYMEKNADGVDTVGYDEDGFYTYNSSFPKLLKPQDAELAYLILWTVQRLPVKDIVYDETDGLLSTVKMDQPYYSNALKMICDGGAQPTIGQKFMIENDLALLDKEGEFYFDKDTKVIYYKPFEEEDLSTARTVVAKTEQLFNISGSSAQSKVKNITFDNIDFRYAGYYTTINEKGAVSFQAENLASGSTPLRHNPISTGVGRTLDANILVENADGIEFTDCDISCMGASALRLGSGTTNSSVKGSTFTNIGGGALSIGTWEAGRAYNSTQTAAAPGALAENVSIENNLIARVGLDFMFCPGISIYYAKGINVLHNTITQTPYSGISVNWGWAYKYTTTSVGVVDEEDNPVLDSNGEQKKETVLTTTPTASNKLGAGGHNISYNRIYDISRTVVDGGHIYNVGYMTDTYITNNYLTDSPDHGGVYLDTGASNVKINNNVFERCDEYNIAYGDSKLVFGNVAKDNWADKEQSKTWQGEGCSFETVVGVTDGSWPDEARTVMNNAGLETGYKANLSRLEIPSWRTLDHHYFPKTEGTIPGMVYINSTEHSRFYIKPDDKPQYDDDGNLIKKGKTEPAHFYLSGTYSIGDFRQGEWLEYTVDIEEAGDYYLSIYYNKGSDGYVDIYLTAEPIDPAYDNMWPKVNENVPKPLFEAYTLAETNTKTTAYIPHIFTDTATGQKKPITLKKGTYYLRIRERSGGTNFSRFALTPVK